MEREPLPSGAEGLEVKTERDTAFGLAEGSTVDVVRVMYRKPPTRRWTKFLLVPDEGQPLEELEQYAPDAAAVHATPGLVAAMNEKGGLRLWQ